jgi:hypothetical protein
MKVLHMPIEIAGQIGVLCNALRGNGHFASGYNFFSTYLGYKDYLTNADSFEMARMFEPASRFFDLFHYHYGLSILPNHRDIKILRSLGKPVVMHHWGNDVRTREMATVNNRFVYTGDCPDSDKVHRDLTTLKEYITDAIVQDYEVYPYVAPYYKRVHVIPIAINMRLFKPYYPDVDVRKPTILHAPTNQDFKGTQYIEQAIEKLKLERNFNYIRVEKMEHQKAIALYKKADIIIDQILCGSYGLLSVEGMAYGKPVVAYIREDLAAREDAPPIHNANPETIYDVLKYLIDHPEVRHRSGVAGREYVKRVHDSNVVIKKIMDVYQLAMSEV